MTKIKQSLIITAVIMIFAVSISVGVFSFYRKMDNKQSCIAVAVPMRNQETDECKVLSPCNIPSSAWIEDDNCLNSETLDTSDWKTYQNEVYGFKLSYPNGFIERESYGQLFSAEKHSEGNDYFISAHIKKNHRVDGDLIFQNRTANKYYFQEGAGYSGVFQVQLNDSALEIIYDMIGGKDKEIYVKDEFDKIISTIKFE